MWLLEMSSSLSFCHLFSFLSLLRKCANLVAGTEVINEDSLIASGKQNCRPR